jgi:hypothetical protein
VSSIGPYRHAKHPHRITSRPRLQRGWNAAERIARIRYPARAATAALPVWGLVQSEYSDCRAVIGSTVWARRIVSTHASESPMCRTLPSANKFRKRSTRSRCCERRFPRTRTHKVRDAGRCSFRGSIIGSQITRGAAGRVLRRSRRKFRPPRSSGGTTSYSGLSNARSCVLLRDADRPDLNSRAMPKPLSPVPLID